MAEAVTSTTAEILAPVAERVTLPAFLEGDKESGYKLPEGYKEVNLRRRENR